jgi:hypothetical protein
MKVGELITVDRVTMLIPMVDKLCTLYPKDGADPFLVRIIGVNDAGVHVKVVPPGTKD